MKRKAGSGLDLMVLVRPAGRLRSRSEAQTRLQTGSGTDLVMPAPRTYWPSERGEAQTKLWMGSGLPYWRIF